jgi:hypothetical protein
VRQTVTGSGTPNNISKFAGTSSVGNSILFDNGTSLGVGTSSPTYKLDVNGSIRMNTSLILAGTQQAPNYILANNDADYSTLFIKAGRVKLLRQRCVCVSQEMIWNEKKKVRPGIE